MSQTLRSDRTVSLAELPPCAGGGNPHPSRRAFCAAAGAGLGLITIGLPGCDGAAERVSTGAINDDPLAPLPTVPNDPQDGPGDMGAHPRPDMRSSGNNPDLSQEANCPSSALNVGNVSSFADGTAQHFSSGRAYNLFVCRDGQGIYALSAACTHDGVTVQQQGNEFYCSRHGATFDLNGDHPTSPARSPLKHYAVCVDAAGNVFVDYKTVVPDTTRA